jgi:hypothetical protein
MSFSNVPSITGVPDFGLIHISPEEVAKSFQTYLDTASKLTGVSLDDISRNVYELPPDVNRITLVDLIKRGMKLFDAVVWLTAGKPASHPLSLDPSMSKDAIPSLHDVARAVFYCYFMLVTQARYPASRGTAEAPKIPNFLRTIMGMDSDQHIYVEKICSFAPQKFDPAWARHVQFEGFGQEVLSRFGLGVAGYRLFGPFALYNAKPGLTPELQRAFKFARSVATAPSSWNVHPLTRNPNILTARGNLNKNLGNLILEVFSESDIAEMVTAKILFGKPVKEPNHRNYNTWGEHDDITGTAYIFRP